jgi:regulatory protein YycI of two-component signal transduction system YycFG
MDWKVATTMIFVLPFLLVAIPLAVAEAVAICAGSAGGDAD